MRHSGSRLFKDRGGKYWGSGVLYSFISPAAGKAGGTGPALVDSAAAGLGWLGSSVLTSWPKDRRWAS